MFVPLTDYSDRLDAMVDGLITEVNDRTHLLLVVGIAGTLFGLFEFAFRAAPTLGPTPDILQINKALAQSMAKAFPVGFVGLMLMLGFQILMAGPDSRLLRALASATNRALQYRQTVSRTQADAVLAAANTIRDSMRSLENLDETLTQQLTPVVDKFGVRLEEALELIRRQSGQTEAATKRFEESAQALNISTDRVLATTKDLRKLLQKAPDVLERTATLLAELDSSMTHMFEEGQQVIESAGNTLSSFSNLPEQMAESVKTEVRDAYTSVGDDIKLSWQRTLGELAASIDNQFADTQRHIKNVATELRRAAAEWDRIASNPDAILTQPFAEPLEAMRVNLGQSLKNIEELIQMYPGRDDVVRLGEALQQASQLPKDDLQKAMRTELRPQFERVEKQLDRMERLIPRPPSPPPRGILQRAVDWILRR